MYWVVRDLIRLMEAIGMTRYYFSDPNIGNKETETDFVERSAPGLDIY